MKIFKYSGEYYLKAFMVIVFSIVLSIIINNAFITLIYIFLSCGVLYGIVSKSFVKYIIDDEKLFKKTPTKMKTLIYWSEVKTIAKLAYAKDSVGVFGDSSKFIINRTIKDYREMVRLVIELCRANPSIMIGENLDDFIKGNK